MVDDDATTTTTIPPNNHNNRHSRTSGEQQSEETVVLLPSVLYNLHCKCCNFALRKTNRWLRSRLEELILISAVCSFVALLLMHVTFLQGSVPSQCLERLPGFSHQCEATHFILMMDGSTEHQSSFVVPNCTMVPAVQHEESTVHFTYSKSQGWLRYPHLWDNENVQCIHISMSDAACFGEPFLQTLIVQLHAVDTVLINWMIGAFGNQGFVYNPRSGRELSLSLTGHDRRRTSTRTPWLVKWIFQKVSMVAKTTFLFFITTTLVSFTLRETQGRMLHFTRHLLQHVRTNRPVVNLVVKHVAENVVFVPIMVGIIFFLMEFYRDDKLLAFMILTLLWICESFSVVSLRTVYGIQYFPRTFFLLFSAFHFYYFSFPFGFAYAALTTAILFMAHSMLFFWHRYELPAVCRGQVQHSLQQQVSAAVVRHNDPEESSSATTRFGLNGEVMLQPSESFLNIQESSLQAIVGPDDEYPSLRRR